MMGAYKIHMVELPTNDTTSSARPMEAGIGIKEAFWDNNLSLYCCIAMILGKVITEVRWKDPHNLLYGKYLGGFLFEGFDKLPPLCILHVLSVGIPYNVVYYNGLIYDSKTGIFTVDEYDKKFIKILSYIQIFIKEAYEQVEWKPVIPDKLQAEIEKDKNIKSFFNHLPAMQQSMIINYIHPFSKPNSLREKRTSSQPLTSKQIEKMISQIRLMYQQQTDCKKNVWEKAKGGVDDMVIRMADNNDIDELVKIRLAYLEEDYNGLSEEQLVSVIDQLPGYFREHIGKEIFIYIAEENQEFISSVFLLVIEKPANPHFITGKIGNILNVYTKPEYRRQGIAGELLKKAMEDAKEMKLSYLELSATKAGYPLYKKMGFSESMTEYVKMKFIL